MKSRLIKFACQGCGTKLAVPPEMAGVSDQCPRCGAVITAPETSTIESAPKKAKAGPKSKPTAVMPPPGTVPAAPTRAGASARENWSASELADALKPRAKALLRPSSELPVSTPAPPVSPPPPASPPPPKRLAGSDSELFPNAGNQAPGGRQGHEAPGNALPAQPSPRITGSKTKTLKTSFPASTPSGDQPTLPSVPRKPVSPSLESAPRPQERLVQHPQEQPAPSPAARPRPAREPAANGHPAPANEAPYQQPASPLQHHPIAFAPQSLHDERSETEAAMPGMGEMLAGGQGRPDPAAVDPRDPRPLLNVPFLPVAESPHRERRALKRRLYITGAILFLVLDAVLLIWFFGGDTGAASNEPEVPEMPQYGGETSHVGAPDGPTVAAPVMPSISSPSDFPAAGAAGVPKRTTPPLAIPLPGHSNTNVPTATPVVPSAAPATPVKDTSKEPIAGTASGDTPVPLATLPPEIKMMEPPDLGVPGAGVAGADPPGKSRGPPNPASTPVAPAPTAPVKPDPPTKTLSRQAQPHPLPLPTFDPPPGMTDPLPTPQLGTLPPLAPDTATALSSTALSSTAPPPAPAAPTVPPPAAASPTPLTPPPAATTGLTPPTSPPRINKVPADAKPALDTLQKFLAAPDWQARAAFVQKPAAVKPTMEKHAAKFGDGAVYPTVIDFVERYVGKDGAPPYCMFEVSGGTLPHPVLVLVEQPPKGEPVVDWEAFVEFKDDLLLKFLETEGAPAQTFRVLMRRKHYFDKDVPEIASKDAFQLQQPNAAFDGHVFIPKSNPLSKQLANQLGWSQDMPVVVELAWKTNGKHHWVEISKIVSYGWRT